MRFNMRETLGIQSRYCVKWAVLCHHSETFDKCNAMYKVVRTKQKARSFFYTVELLRKTCKNKEASEAAVRVLVEGVRFSSRSSL